MTRYLVIGLYIDAGEIGYQRYAVEVRATDAADAEREAIAQAADDNGWTIEETSDSLVIAGVIAGIASETEVVA